MTAAAAGIEWPLDIAAKLARRRYSIGRKVRREQPWQRIGAE
jgi:hypothetical protein